MVQLFQRKKIKFVCLRNLRPIRIEISYVLSEDYIGIFIFFAIQIPKKYICLECKGTILMEIPWCNNN